jgi:hypothetical protein
MITDGRSRKEGVLMRSARQRVVTTFDLFVVAVILGYVLVVVQSAVRGGGPTFPFAPSSQLYHDSAPPTERPAGAEVTMLLVD